MLETVSLPLNAFKSEVPMHVQSQASQQYRAVKIFHIHQIV